MFARRQRGTAAARLRVAVGIGAAVGTVLVLAPTGAVGAPAPSGPAKSAAAPAPQQPARICTLSGSGHAEHDEWASCLRVDARLDTIPGRGQTARLQVDVTAEHTEQQVRIEADLPANLAWAQAPAGLSRAQVASAAPETGGRLDRVSGTRAMTAGTPQRFAGTVTAIGSGPAQIRVRALIERGGGNVDAAEDSVFLTIGQPGRASVSGIEAGDAAIPAPAGTVVGKPASPRPYKPVGTGGLAAPHSDDPGRVGSAVENTCVTGNWAYVDNTGATRPSRSFQVQVWDSDPIGDDLLKTGFTDGNGHYHLCFDNDDGIGGAGQDVYLLFVAENSVWRVHDASGTPYKFITGVVDDVATGSDTNFGTLLPTTSAMRGAHAFDEAQDAWNGTPGSCWDLNDAVCRQVKIRWTADSVDGTVYRGDDDTVHLLAIDPDAPITVVHEIGHAIMDDVYEDNFPATGPKCVKGHLISGVTSAGCAWTEGFAEWFPLKVYNDTFFRSPDGGSFDLENQTWDSSNFEDGEEVEGRVAGALLDLNDTGNEFFWDHYSEAPFDQSFDSIWHEFQTTRPVTFADFWNRRTADKSDAGALASVYQNTIDYGYREPLGTVSLNRPTPTPHNYRFDTTSANWSVVAIRPGSDLDLDLFDDRPQATKLTTSSAGGSTADFIAVNSGLRPLGDYYPRVRPFNGATGNYEVQVAVGSSTLPSNSSQSLPMSFSDIVAVRDTVLLPNAPTTITVSRLSGSGDAELFVLGSTNGVPSTAVQPRLNAIAMSSVAGPGGTETLTVTAPSLGHYAVVVINKSGTGTYTLSRS